MCQFVTGSTRLLALLWLVICVVVMTYAAAPALAGDLTFSYGGTAPWFSQNLITHDGIDAQQSGAISHSQSSWMETTVTGPGAIRFWWKVSSESCCDPLQFNIDGTSQSEIRGEIGWQNKAFTIPAGSHTLRWTYSTDSSVLTGSNAGWVDQITFETGSNIDVTPPVTSVSPASGTVATSQTVTLTANEPATIYYTTNGSEPTTSSTQYSTPLTISGTTTLKFFAVDTAGNYEPTKTATYTFDTTPPSTGTSLSPGTYSGRRDVSLQCSDSGMGCAATYYCLGSGCTPATLYSSTIAITASTDLRYYSTDRAGNSEGVKTSTFTITPDSTPPTTTPGYASGTYGPMYAYFSCSDGSGSGCSGTYYCLGAGCTPATTYSSSIHITTSTDLRFYSQDRSGNSEAVKTVSYVIDQTPPVTTANPPGGSYETAPLITLACSDGAGTGCSRTYYCTGASCTPSILYGTPVPINDTTVLRFYSTDNASNNEAIVTHTYLKPNQPKTITVPGMRPTIQSAIDAAYNGDTVLVAPGTYQENINYKGKGITVASSDGPETTIIDGNKAGSVVTFSSGENLSAELNGFTIRNGANTYQGGGIYIDHASPTVLNNRITGNSASWGAGIHVNFASPSIRNNSITQNTNSSYGGGISIGGAASAQIIDNTISDNRSSDGGGISMWAAGTPLIKGNRIMNNSAYETGGGLYIVNSSSAMIVQNLITNNKAATGGALYGGSSDDTFVNNSFINNTSTQGASVYLPFSQFVNNIVLGVSGQAALYRFSTYLSNFSHNLVYSPSGSAYENCPDQNGINGNITADPRLSNQSLGYFGLMPASPAIDAGNNSAPSLPATDFGGMERIVDGNNDGTAVIDIGAYEFDPTWPVATLQGIPTGYLTSDTLDITVGGTGVVSYRYALDGGEFSGTDIAVVTPIHLTGLTNGQHLIVVLGKNNLGQEQLLSSATAAKWVVNTETTNLIFTYGGEAPWFVQATVSHDGIAYQSGSIFYPQSSWMETSVTGPGAIRFWWKVSSQEYTSPLMFSIDGTSQTSISGEVDWQNKAYIIPAGSHVLRWTYSSGVSVSVGSNAGWVDGITYAEGSNIDVTPPATSATPPAGMYASNQGVTLTCSDAGGSGCAGTFYCLGSGCNPAIPYSGPISISTATDLRFYSTDVAGNSEIVKTATYSFDRTPPSTSNSLGSGTYSGRHDVSLYCNDIGMGCATTYYCLGSGCTPATLYSSVVAITDSTELRYYSVDRGGNSEAVKTSTYTITPDVTAPATTASHASGTYTPISAYLSCSDGAGSGCANTYYCLGTGCTPTTPFSTSIYISASTDLRFYSSDRSGNTEGITTVAYTIDAAPPVTNPSPPGGIYAAPQNVALACNDGTGSGCLATYYCLGTGCYPDILYSGPIAISASTYLTYYSQDTLRNNEAWKSIRYNITSSPPVTINVPADRATIQAAIDAANDGDTVLVAPGTYVEKINFKGKAITVQSSNGPEATVIDGNRQGSVVVFSSHEWTTSVLSGFTIRNGGHPPGFSGIIDGGGIYIYGASPIIINNKIIQNLACNGAGIYARGNPVIQGNLISGNSRAATCSGGYGGGGIYLSSDTAQLVYNTITNNALTYASGGGIYLYIVGNNLIRGNVISNNGGLGVSGGGIYIENHDYDDAPMVQNLISGNRASLGGGIFIRRGAILVNNTIAENDAVDGSGIYVGRYALGSGKLTNNIVSGKAGQTAIYSESSSMLNPSLKNNILFSPTNNVFGGTFTDQNGINGNITADPLLNSPAFGYFGLRPGSPAIDAGDNSAPALPAIDLNGVPRIIDGSGLGLARVDIGGYEYDPDEPRAVLAGQPSGVIRETAASITVGGAGIVSYRYALDGGPFTASDTPVDTPIVLNGLVGGTHAVAVIGKTLAREQSASSATVAGWTIDTIPPVTTATPPGGSYTGPQDVTLACSDTAGSSCSGSFYCLGSDCLPTTPYTGPITITTTTALRYYSRDAFDNQEAIRTANYTYVGTISGRVTDSVTGNGIPWTNVMVVNVANGSPIIYTSTDGSGNYQFSGLVSGGYKVRFTAYDYVEQWYNGKPDLSAADTVTVSAPAMTAGINAVMVKGGSISGIVSASDTGAGIQNVFVGAYNALSGAQVGYGYTDSSGAYTVSGLANGTYRLRFSVDSMTTYLGQWYSDKEQFSTATDIAVTAPNIVGGINVTLGKAGTISGRVVDSISAAGIQNVFVDAYNALSGAQVGYGYTDSAGAYSITGLAGGSYKLRFSATGYLTRWFDGQTNQASATAVTVSAPNTTASINVALGRGGSISGTIADRSSGAGIAGVYLYIIDRSSGAWAGSATTDSSGRYTISGLDSGSYRLRIDPPSSSGYPGRWYDGQDNFMCAGTVSVTAPDTSSIDILLDRGGSISGRITDSATGSGIPGVGISLMNNSTQTGMYTPIVTDSTGAYTVAGLPSGDYSLTFIAPGYIRSTAPVIVMVSAPGVTSGIDASLVRGGVISGRITDRATGNGLGNIMIEAVDTSTRLRIGSNMSDINGTYIITGLPSGSYAIYYDGRSSGGTYGSGWKTVPSAGAATAVTSGASASIATPPPPVPPIDPIFPVPIGLVQPPLLVIPSSALVVPVVAPAASDGIDILIDPLGAISGRVTDITTGMPLDWVSVIAYDSISGSAAGSALTTIDGSYTISGLPSGSYWVRFGSYLTLNGVYQDTWYSNGTGSGVATEVVVQAPQITSGIDMQLARGGGISGRISVSSCPAPRFIKVKAYDAATGTLVSQGVVVTNYSDRFTISALPPGSYKLAIEPSETGFARQWYLNKTEMTGADPVAVTAGTITSLGDVTLAAGGGSISGTVVGNADCASLPVPIKLYDWSTGGLVAEGLTSSDGSYRFSGLPDASYKILFTVNQFDRWYRTAGETAPASAVVVSGGLPVSGIDLTGACAPDATCGSDNGQTLAQAAPTALCAKGTPSAVSGSGHPWSWNCQGDPGTAPVACSSAIQTYSLSLSVPAASGTGEIQADLVSNDEPPVALFCPASYCSALFDYGRTVRLTAIPDAISLFSAWGGDCAADPCDVTMTSPKAVTALFSRAYCFKNVSSGMLDNSLATLVSASNAGNEIRMLATELAIDALILDKGLALSGGWKGLYQAQDTNPTTLSGTITVKAADSTINDTTVKGGLFIQSGSLKVKRMSVAPAPVN